MKPAQTVAAAAVLATLAAPATPAAAEEVHVDAAFGAVVPLFGDAYREAVSFGGRLAARAHRGRLAGQLELGAFTEGSADVERLTYRTRVMAGTWWRRQIEGQRGLVVRTLAGVELGGFDRVGTGSRWPEAHHLGFAAEVGFDSHNELHWGEVSMGVALALTVQPFGEQDGGDYVGLEGVAQLAVGF